MPVYLYWGNDEFAIAQAVNTLRSQVIDPMWESFNSDKISPDQPDAVIHALNQAMTPPFGAGQRFVWLADTTLGQKCPDDLFSELERTLPTLPETSVLLMTSKTKLDSRLKVTKFLQKHAEIKEFSLIETWKTDLLIKQVQQVAQTMQIKLTPGATELLAESVGNDTRQLYSELEKLRLYVGNEKRSLTETDIATLVINTAQTTFKLGEAIRQGQTAKALEVVNELLQRNEPGLRIVSSLVSQFRTWVWVKVMLDSGERDDTAIAQAAGLGNPKRLYFIKKEVQPLPLKGLLKTLPILLELEASLKLGADELLTLQTKVIELCNLYQKPR